VRYRRSTGEGVSRETAWNGHQNREPRCAFFTRRLVSTSCLSAYAARSRAGSLERTVRRLWPSQPQPDARLRAPHMLAGCRAWSQRCSHQLGLLRYRGRCRRRGRLQPLLPQEGGVGGLTAQQVPQEVGGVAGAARAQQDAAVAQPLHGIQWIRREEALVQVRREDLGPQVAVVRLQCKGWVASDSGARSRSDMLAPAPGTPQPSEG
jgi:hypothetical protein